MQLLSFWTVGTACGSLGGIHYLTINGYVANRQSGKEIILGAPPDGGSTYNCDSYYQYTICN